MAYSRRMGTHTTRSRIAAGAGPIALLALLALALGCNDAEDAGANRDTMGADQDCVIVSTTAVAWTAETSLGTPAEVFASATGSCEADLAWDGSGWSSLAITPESGTDRVTATVTVDEGSARWVEQRADEAASGDVACGPYLEVDAAVTLETTDGTIARDAPTTVRTYGDETAPTVDVELTPGDVEDWIEISAPADTTVHLFAQLAPLGEACAGEMTLRAETSHGNTGTGAAQTGFATWSDTDANRDTMGADDDCVIVSTTAVAWTAETSLGTPAEVYSSAAGSCEADLAWDGSGWSPLLAITPEAGTDRVTATVTVDEGSARWVEQRKSEAASGVVACGSYLEIDAAVTLETTNGTIARDAPTTVRTYGDETAPTVDVELTPGDVEDWIEISAPADTTVHLFAQLAPLGEACVGEMMLWTETTRGNTGTGGGQPGFATWSDTDCGVGEFAVDLTEPFRGVDLLAELASAFGAAEVSATWNDESETVLDLAVSTEATEACARDLDENVEIAGIPIEVTLATDDGRLVALTAPGEARAVFSPDGLLELQFGFSTDLECDSEADVLPYRSPDCAEVASVTAQLIANHYAADPGQDGGTFEAYVTFRESTAVPGAADTVESLRWGP